MYLGSTIQNKNIKGLMRYKKYTISKENYKNEQVPSCSQKNLDAKKFAISTMNQLTARHTRNKTIDELYHQSIYSRAKNRTGDIQKLKNIK